MQLAFASGRMPSSATTYTNRSLPCFKRHRAGQQRRVINMFELPLCMAKAYGKAPPQSQKRILHADGMSGIKSKNYNGLKTLLISDGARCYPTLARQKSLLHRACNHSKGIFNLNKRLPKKAGQRSTQEIYIYIWFLERGLKKSNKMKPTNPNAHTYDN